jgi:hypothetical protein
MGNFVGVAVTYITSSRDAPLTEAFGPTPRQWLVVAKITQNRVNEFTCSWCKSANFNTGLYITDLARSVKFYNEVLGFAPFDADERITARMWVTATSCCCARRALQRIGSVPPDGDGELHVAFALPRNQFQDRERRLAEHGVSIEHRRLALGRTKHPFSRP